MKRYQVDFIDNISGACSPIDIITASDNYTAADYMRDCESNADSDYIDMLHSGDIVLTVID